MNYHDTAIPPYVWLLWAAMMWGAIFVYVAPGVIASVRRHPNVIQIWILTIMLGWTFFGWVLAVIWSVSSIRKA
jgi:hypothetical protein